MLCPWTPTATRRAAQALCRLPASRRWRSSSSISSSISSISSSRRAAGTVGAAKAKRAAPASDSPAPLLPTSLALQDLRTLAVLCGRNSAGTKQALRADLEAAVLATEGPERAVAGAAATADGTAPLRILSVDMGVRNLAYCLLEVAGANAHGGAGDAVPRLVAWERLSLIGDEKQPSADDTPPSKPAAALFAPPAMAVAAARLVRDRLLPLAPTHVLIERQRFRSGGGAAVLEWTVRVNSLEAMLHGILAFHRLAGQRGGQADGAGAAPIAQAVSPQRVSQFLLRGGMGEGAGADALRATKAKTAAAARTKAKDIKDAKEAFVAALLRAAQDSSQTTAPSLLHCDPALRDLADAFLDRWEAKEARGRSREKPKTARAATPDAAPESGGGRLQLTLSKIDDLADCVAQGLIWLAWERNKVLLRHHGAEALLAENHLTG